MELKEIVFKLVGEISPQGASHIDDKRLENLKVLCNLVSELITEIDDVAYKNKDRQEMSVKLAGKYAKDFLTNNLGII